MTALDPARLGVRRCRASWLATLLVTLNATGLAAGCRSAPGSAAAPPTLATTAAAHAQPARVVSAPVPALAVASGEHAGVSSAEPNATAIGLAVLEGGGNAVDAAVAVAFALGVTHPSAGNIGGGGFMLVRTPAGQSTAIDYREVAPQAAHANLYLDEQGHATSRSQYGPLAAGIPGVVAGLALAHQRFGTRSWQELIGPAIELARAGHALDASHVRELKEAREEMLEVRAQVARQQLEAQRQPAGPAATLAALAAALDSTLATFSRADGSALHTGDLWRQPALARTLELLAHEGPQAFYRGGFARDMAQAVSAMGGIWTVQDLERYSALERAPLHFGYHGHEIITMPPPSAGGVVLRQILAGADALRLERLDWDSADRMHLYVEVLRRAYADRNEWLGDPDFVEMPLTQLLNPAYMAQRVASIDPAHATPSSQIRAGLPLIEPPHTTHFSVVDASGMAVANTFTLNTSFGAQLQIPSTGVTLNNEMDDFTTQLGEPNLFGLVQGTQNAIAPGKRMLSSMTPTIVLRQGRLRAVLGSPGGPTITTTVAQLLLQMIDHGRSLQQAVRAPRLHHQWLPDEIAYEPGVSAAALAALRQRGHTAVEVDHIGHANCIEIDPETRILHAVADVERGGGAAAAY
jgi:gamma-glutamyltranspeptidase / glutathione hydrolase